MKKWYFSNDMEITGPLDLKEANDLISRIPNLYAWHPSNPQWVPVSCIDEFESVIPVPKPPREVPSSLLEQLFVEEKDMVSTLKRVDNTLKMTSVSLKELDSDIEHNTELTHNLNLEVKAALKSIEQQFAELQKSLAVVKQKP